jgi:hypothetical protein
MKYLKNFNESDQEIDLNYNEFLDIRDISINLEDKEIILDYRLFFDLRIIEFSRIEKKIDITNDSTIEKDFKVFKEEIQRRTQSDNYLTKRINYNNRFGYKPTYLEVRIHLNISKHSDVYDKMNDIMECISFIKNMGYKTELIFSDNVYYIKIYLTNEIFKKV